MKTLKEMFYDKSGKHSTTLTETIVPKFFPDFQLSIYTLYIDPSIDKNLMERVFALSLYDTYHLYVSVLDIFKIRQRMHRE